MTKIYTRRGDGGRTGTFLGRKKKSDGLVAALGVIDELNSWVGWVRGRVRYDTRLGSLEEELKRIQSNLMTVASGLAGSGLELPRQEVRRLEKLIDRLSKDLPVLKNFVYPVGELQVVRAVARRAERAVVGMGEGVGQRNMKYLNRLSDALFVMARWMNLKLGVEEEVWKS